MLKALEAVVGLAQEPVLDKQVRPAVWVQAPVPSAVLSPQPQGRE